MPTIYKFDVAGKQISTETAPSAPDALYADLKTDTLYASQGGTVKPVNGGTVNTAVWRSKVIKAPSGVPTGFSWIRANGALASGVTVKLYANGVLVYTTPPLTGEPQRLPARMARSWEIEMTGAERVTTLVLSDNTEGLL